MSGSTSTELQEILIKNTRFSPKRAINRLVKAETTENKIRTILKTWELARLLGWVVLDQQPGTRQPKVKASGTSKSPKRRIRKSNARRAGDITLAWLLDDILNDTKERRSNEDGADFALIFELIKSRGGFLNLVEGRGGKLLLSQAARKIRELGYIYRLIDFLCRYQDNNPDLSKFDITAAIYFVAKQEHEDDKTYGVSRIEKIWLKYKDAAPYVYSFYECLSSRLAGAISINEAIKCIKNLASDRGRLTDLIGKAAYVADILSERKVRNVRIQDFVNVARVHPSTGPFSADEITIIASIDRQAPIR
jgi:hypothetical protein